MAGAVSIFALMPVFTDLLARSHLHHPGEKPISKISFVGEGETGRWCDMVASHTVIAIKFARVGEWEADEGAGVRSSFAGKQQAIDYGMQRIAFHRAELRIHGKDGSLERTIAFNEAGDLILTQ